MALFVIAYYFYELGLPGGLTLAAVERGGAAQQVTSVERGYNIYQANCARCHGANGEGGIGPILNRQDKLFAHLNEDYLHNVLEVGGRYVCGNPNSVMPVWADTATRPARSTTARSTSSSRSSAPTSSQEFEVRDAELNEPVKNPDGSVKTFHGWVDSNYKPAAGRDALPGLLEG